MRNKKNMIEADAEDTRDDVEKALDQFSELAENGGVSIIGKVYRITAVNEINGKVSSEFCGKVDGFVDEDFIGQNFGSGKYKVRFSIKGPSDSRATERNVIYNVGPEYDKFVKKPSNNEPPRGLASLPEQQPRSGFLDSFLNGLTPEKITAYSLAVKTLKELFAPPPPPPSPDWAQIIALLANKNETAKPALSDTIVLSAMESLKQQQKQPSVLQQVRELKQIKEELGADLSKGIDEDEDDEEDGETMNILLKTALGYLPQLLKQNNNNFQAVGAQAAENPLVKNLVADDPELAQTFFEKAREKYGLENAQKLALGFGYNLTDNTPQADGGELENG